MTEELALKLSKNYLLNHSINIKMTSITEKQMEIEITNHGVIIKKVQVYMQNIWIILMN
jgi:hypothetical protein